MKRKTIELKPGVSLEGIEKQDILIINGKSEVVVENGPLFIKTKRMPNKGYQADGEIEIMIRQRKNYHSKKGCFTDEPLPQIVRMGDEGYELDSGDLINIGRQLK